MPSLLRPLAALLALACVARVAAQVTETPHPIGPGKFLLEVDGLSLALDRADAAGKKYQALGIASTVVSVGLTPRLDLQAGVDLFLRERVTLGGERESRSGFGDATLRTKWAFLQDESVGTVALVPYVKLPSSTRGVGTHSVEGGLIIPWASSTSAVVDAGAMLQWDVTRKDGGDGYYSQWLLTGYVQRDLIGGFSVYGEGAVQVPSTGASQTTVRIGGGLLWQVTKQLQLDYELLRGANNRTVDWTHVLRATWSW